MKNDPLSTPNVVLTIVISAFASGIAVCASFGERSLIVLLVLYSVSIFLILRITRLNRYTLIGIGLALLSGGIYQTGYANLYVLPKMGYVQQQTVFEGILLDASSQPVLHCVSPMAIDLPMHFTGHLQLASGWVEATGKWELSSSVNRAAGLQQIAMLALRPGGYLQVSSVEPVYTWTRWQQLLFTLVTCRQHVLDWPRAQLMTALPADQAALLLGLVFGQTGDIPTSVATGFTALGITHLLAASGANILAVILPLRAILKRLRITGKTKRGAILCCVWLYALLAGASISICRAAILVSLYELRPARAHLLSIYRLLLISFLICLLSNPFWLFDIGFQLTFLVTCGLVTGSRPLERYLQKKSPWLMRYSRVSRLLSGVLLAESLSFPLIAFYFHQWSFLSALTNLTITPLVEMLVPVGLCLVVVASISAGWFLLPAKLLGAGIAALSQLATFAGSIPGVTMAIAFPGGCLVLYLASYLLLLLSSSWLRFSKLNVSNCFRWAGCAGLAGTVAWLGALNLQLPRTDQMQVWFLDVGQGDATLIRLANGHFCLIDGGGSAGYPNSYDVGRLVLLPALRKLQVNQIDFVILTDSKATHAAGLIPLLDQIPVKEVLTSGDLQTNLIVQLLLAKVNEHHIPLQTVEIQTNMLLDPWTSLQVLEAPTGPQVQAQRIASLSFVIRTGSTTMLFAGDLTDVQETSRLSNWPQADVLKIPRGGGNHSTSALFLDRVSPAVAVISAGQGSRSKVNPSTLELLQSKEVPVYRTDLDGTIHLTVGNAGLHVDTERN